MKTEITHDTFTIERMFRASRQRAYEAWADYDKKAKWFVGPAGRWTAIKREMNFAVGGEEVVVGDFSGHGASGFYATYQDIIPLESIVYSYRMYVDEALLSISLVTVEFHDNGAGSRTVFTEQGVYFGDPTSAENRRVGSEMLMDNIVRSLDGE